MDWPNVWRAAADWYAECVCVALLAGNTATAAAMHRRWARARERQDSARKKSDVGRSGFAPRGVVLAMDDPHPPYLWLYGQAFAEGSDLWCRLAWRAANGDELAQIACLEEIADRTGVPRDLEQSVQRALQILG